MALTEADLEEEELGMNAEERSATGWNTRIKYGTAEDRVAALRSLQVSSFAGCKNDFLPTFFGPQMSSFFPTE